MKKNNISEQTVIAIIWSSVMSTVEWNKKEELVAEQAIKHLKVCNQVEAFASPGVGLGLPFVSSSLFKWIGTYKYHNAETALDGELFPLQL